MAMLHSLQGATELLDVLEVLVDRSKTDIGNIVDIPQALKHHITQLLGTNLPARKIAELGFHTADELFKQNQWHTAFYSSREQTAQQFLAIERLRTLVAFDDYERSIFENLNRREPKATVLALSTAPNLPSIF